MQRLTEEPSQQEPRQNLNGILNKLERNIADVIQQSHGSFCTTRNNLVLLALTLGSITGTPYMAPAKDFAGSNKKFGYTLLVAEVISIGGLTDYIFLDILDTILKRKLVGKSYCDTQLVLSFLLGFFTALPSTIIGYVYNKGNPLDYAYAAVAFYADFISNSFALNTSFSLISHKIKEVWSKDRLVYRLKSQVNALIEKSYEELSQLTADDYGLKLHDFPLLQTYFDNPEQFAEQIRTHDNLLRLLRELITYSQTNRSNQRSSHCLNTTKSILGLVFALSMPLNWTPVAFKLVYNQSIELLKNKPLTIGISTLSACPLYLLEGILDYRLFTTSFDIVGSLYRCDFKLPVAHKALPKMIPVLYYLTLLLFFACGALSFPTRALVIEDNFNDPYKRIGEVWTSTMVVLYKTFALLSCVNFFFNFILNRFGDATSKKIVTLEKMVAGNVHILEQSDNEQFTQLLEATLNPNAITQDQAVQEGLEVNQVDSLKDSLAEIRAWKEANRGRPEPGCFPFFSRSHGAPASNPDSDRILLTAPDSREKSKCC